MITHSGGRKILYVLVALGVVIRLFVLLAAENRLDSDEATIGVMALDILEEGTHPIFFYGASYNGGGAMEAYLALLSDRYTKTRLSRRHMPWSCFSAAATSGSLTLPSIAGAMTSVEVRHVIRIMFSFQTAVVRRAPDCAQFGHSVALILAGAAAGSLFCCAAVGGQSDLPRKPAQRLPVPDAPLR